MRPEWRATSQGGPRIAWSRLQPRRGSAPIPPPLVHHIGRDFTPRLARRKPNDIRRNQPVVTPPSRRGASRSKKISIIAPCATTIGSATNPAGYPLFGPIRTSGKTIERKGMAASPKMKAGQSRGQNSAAAFEASTAMPCTVNFPLSCLLLSRAVRACAIVRFGLRIGNHQDRDNPTVMPTQGLPVK